MIEKCIEFKIRDGEVVIHGYPELENRKGVIVGDGIAFFFGEGWRNYELYIANIVTGKIRKLSTANGNLLVDDSDIDYDAIAQESENGIGNARQKLYAMQDSIDGTILKMDFVPFRGCCILTDDILLMKTVLVWKTMMKRKYMQSLIQT